MARGGLAMPTTTFSGNPDNQGEVVATAFFGYLDIEDSTHPHPALNGKGERFGYYRKAMAELRDGVIAGCPVIQVSHLDEAYKRGSEIPHMGHDIRCQRDDCPGTPATRYFGLEVMVLGKVNPPVGTGHYNLANGKVRVYLTGGSYRRAGTINLEAQHETTS
jgi:hypothetical protein